MRVDLDLAAKAPLAMPPPLHVASLSARSIAPWLALAVLFAVAIIERLVLPANTDISWLLTIGERYLDGARLYADIIEVNPPIAVLVYLPAIVIAHGLGLAPEAVVDVLVFAAILAALAIVAQILRNTDVLGGLADGRRAALGVVVFAILANLPAQTFGQREHIALLAFLPAIAVFLVRARGEAPSAWAVVVAGLGAGVMLAFKPYFAIPCGAAAVTVAMLSRSWRPLFAVENLIALVVVGLYALFVVMVFPDYVATIVPLVRDVYLKVQLPWPQLLTNVAISLLVATMLAAGMLKRRTTLDPNFLVLSAIAAGFAAAFLLQRKGWPYQSYPMLAVALMALADALATSSLRTVADRVWAVVAFALLGLGFVAGMIWLDLGRDMRVLEVSVGRIATRPKILVLSGEPSFGYPLVRAVHGTSVSRQQAFWVRNYIAWLKARGPIDPDDEARLTGYAARERAMLIEDFRRQPPDAVLIETEVSIWNQWIAEDSDIAELMKPYEAVANVDGVSILRRKREPST